MDAQTQSSDQRRVFIEDHTGNKRHEAKIAANASTRDLIPALITALGLPVTDPSGRPVTYNLAFADRQLQRDETLNSAEVVDGATVTLVPEMTAGKGT